MPRRSVAVLLPCLTCLFLFAVRVHPAVSVHAPTTSGHASKLILREARSSPLDLEIVGDLAGLPPDGPRFLTREDLLTLPQLTYTVTDDANFAAPTQISGVSLEELTQQLSANPQSDLVVAVCHDLYRAYYPRTYIAAHHPLLVLTVDGKTPDGWPKHPDAQDFDMGPYLISHPDFTPRFSVLSQPEEPQIPWGVVRLDFRDEQKVFGTIAPRGPDAADPLVQSGYRVAQQNCFRCHNTDSRDAQKAGRPWALLAAFATASPDYFSAYVRNPKSKNPHAQMPGNPHYDHATIHALISYFRTQEKP